MLKNMKLSMRLALGFAAVLLLMIILMIVVFFSMNSIQSRLNNIVDLNIYKMNLYNDMSEAIYKVSINLRDMALTTDQSARSEKKKLIEEARAEYDEAWAAIEKTAASETGMALRTEIDRNKQAARPLNDDVVNLALANKDTEAVQLLEAEAGPADQKWQDSLAQAIKIQNDTNEQDAEAAKQAYISTLILMFALGGASIIVGILVAFFMTRSITKPINRVVENLTEGAQQVASASNQLSSTSQQLAEGNSEQASSIEETSATLEESASMVHQNSENTKQAALLAAQAKNAADKGNAEMQEMMSSMSEIKKSSDQISKIIKVIDEIAFQTNILALNAAVEAARAGDAGMGFAVVAEEVRNLAQRSAQAAKDTAAIIETNIELSEQGVNVAKKVGDSLSEITLQAKKVNELMDEIAAASNEQSQGISQINKAISQMEKVTQMNASNAEESASASEELSAQAENLKEIVQQLVKVVNGSSAQNMSNHDYRRIPDKPSYSVRAIETNQAARSIKNTAALKASGLSYDAKRENRKTHVVSPEDVIPLNEDAQDF